ncbi:MAG TPA: Uma2 family endonuclease [Acidimicrobiales bacterium]|jgi:Uma2 family endonuclease|nr:Uma2 family endonuclease [Acidimicrobiales bacterium]
MALPAPHRFNRKLPVYARHGVAAVWLVDVAGQAVELFTDPGPDGGNARGATGADTAAPAALPHLVLEVGSLFPAG